jgi:aspartyl-tRNA synthetase
VIAFPKTAKGTCLMTESPSPISARQLRDLHIELKVPKPE